MLSIIIMAPIILLLSMDVCKWVERDAKWQHAKIRRSRPHEMGMWRDA